MRGLSVVERLRGIATSEPIWMGNMLTQRTATWLLAFGALVLLARGALAQPATANLDYQSPTPTYANASAPFSNSVPTQNSWLPFKPMEVEPKWDWFGPAETSGYGNGPRPKIGWFGSYERLFWSLSKPAGAPVGTLQPFDPLTTILPPPDGPTVDNSFIGATGAWGNRWEVGYVDVDSKGYLVSVLDHVSQGQFGTVDRPAFRVSDPSNLLDGFVPVVVPGLGSVTLDIGHLPSNFTRIEMKNILQLNGVEVMRLYRAPRLHGGGLFELLYGVRWLQVTDTFTVSAFGGGERDETGHISLGGPTTNFTFPGNILDASRWNTRVINNLIGPQIGSRWSQQRGHWIFSLETRFLAAANFQNAVQSTDIGNLTILNQGRDSNLTTAFRGIGSRTHNFWTTFAPVGELRVQTSYQVTSNVALKLGYTGLVVGGMSRASNRVDYDSPNLIGILHGGVHQTFWSNGINFGVEVNR